MHSIRHRSMKTAEHSPGRLGKPKIHGSANYRGVPAINPRLQQSVISDGRLHVQDEANVDMVIYIEGRTQVALEKFVYERVATGTFSSPRVFASQLSSVTRFGVDSKFASLEPANA